MKRFTTQLAILIGLFTLTNLPLNTFGQVKETIYYLADTTNVGKQNQILEIGKEGLFYYVFYCKCVPPYDSYLTFIVPRIGEKEWVFKELPVRKTLSWKELEALASKYWANFNTKYDFYIIERLSNGYKMNKVQLTILDRTPIADIVQINSPSATFLQKRKEQDRSIYKLTEQGIPLNFINLSIQIFDTNGLEISGNIGIRDKKDNPIMNFPTNEKGRSQLQLFETENIGYLTVDNVGYNRVSIPIEKLKNKTLLLQVQLKGQGTSN